MNTLTLAARDTATMLRRNLKHTLRYPTMVTMIIGMPIVLLLLFVYVFGATLGNGLAGTAHGGRAAYLTYVTPGIIAMTVAAAASATAVSVATDMTEGIVTRFRTMAISRVSILSGHVIGCIIQNLLGIAAVTCAAVLLGFRTTAGPAQWIEATGFLTLFVLAITWLSVALGLASSSVEVASNAPMFLMVLPFLGSGFVPTSSMPSAIRWFTEYQPFTPAIQTLRGLLLGTPIGDNAIIAIAGCIGITLACYLWARKLFSRDPSRS